MGKRKQKKKRSVISWKNGVITAVLIVMGFSLYVRWSGIAQRLASEGELFDMEVLNGTGEPGIAKMITRQLRVMGVDVVLEGNASRFDFRESLLIDRRGNPALMRRVSQRFGCSRVLKQYQEDPEVDITLIIGWNRDRLKIGRDD